MFIRINSKIKYLLFFVIIILNINTSWTQEQLTLQDFTSIPSNSVIVDIVERSNSIYVLTSDKVYEVNQSSLESSIFVDNIENAQAIFVDRKRFLIATGNSIIDNNNNVIYDFGVHIKINKLLYFNKNIWVATENGLYKFNYVNAKCSLDELYTKDNSPLSFNSIKTIFKDKTSRLWVVQPKGIVQIRKGKLKSIVYYQNMSVIDISENKKGIWLLFDKKIKLIEKNYNDNFIVLNNGRKRGQATHISCSNSADLFITSNVLTRFDPLADTSRVIENNIELLEKKVSVLKTDMNNNVWIGTHAGLLVLNAKYSKTEFQSKKRKKHSKKVKTKKIVKGLSSIVLIKNATICDGFGELEVQAEGGTPPYKFKWSNGSSSNIISNLSEDHYQVTITDTHGVTSISKVQLDDKRKLEVIPVLVHTVSKLGESDGSFGIEIKGGAPKYRILWDSIEGETINKRLSVGNHKVSVIDQKNCTASIDFFISEPLVLQGDAIRNIELGKSIPIKKINFDSDSTILKDRTKAILSDLVLVLKLYPTLKIEIGGHTNGIPSHKYCDKLSKTRAKNIANYLVVNGVDRNNVQYKGYGKRKPIASNKTKSGRIKNQRVEFNIIGL